VLLLRLLLLLWRYESQAMHQHGLWARLRQRLLLVAVGLVLALLLLPGNHGPRRARGLLRREQQLTSHGTQLLLRVPRQHHRAWRRQHGDTRQGLQQHDWLLLLLLLLLLLHCRLWVMGTSDSGCKDAPMCRRHQVCRDGHAAVRRASLLLLLLLLLCPLPHLLVAARAARPARLPLPAAALPP
jgi:hypothetical protein